jgi:quinol monooxygenase YgiN
MSQFPRTPLEASGRLPVLLVVSLRVKHGFEELVNEELSRLVHTSRLETGCLLFDVYRLANDPARLFLHEVWENRDALEAHASNLHASRFRTAVNSYLERPIERFEVLEVE